MIIVQTPLRVSFFGGGTDFPSYYLAEGGAILSSAIDKYIFVTVKKRFDKKLRIGYTRTEMVDNVEEIQHELIREALTKTGITQGVEVTTMGDIPSEGSGLGSSSTVTVGALHAMYTYLGEILPAEQLAEQACEIEISKLGKPIGKQDQYIAAYGGLRFFEFLPGGAIRATKVRMDDEMIDDLNDQIFRELLTYMMEDVRTIHRALIISHVSKSLERIADHAVGIADMVVYMVTGKSVRHGPPCEPEEKK